MNREEEIKALFFDIYSEKNRFDSLLQKIIDNYHKTIEEGETLPLFWIRDKDSLSLKATVDSLTTSIERLSESVESLLSSRKEYLKRTRY